MNCATCEKLLLREADHLGSSAEQTALEAHLAGCPSCRRLQSELDRVSALIRTEAAAISPPDADAEWRQLRNKLQSREKKPTAYRRMAPVLWWTAPLAAAAAGVFAFILQTSSPRKIAASASDMAGNGTFVTHAEFVEPGDANAITMVYVDKESGWLVVWAADAAPTLTKSG